MNSLDAARVHGHVLRFEFRIGLTNARLESLWRRRRANFITVNLTRPLQSEFRGEFRGRQVTFSQIY